MTAIPGPASTSDSGLAATAVAHPNIALIKYWGNVDDKLRLPANSSVSMTLGGLETRTDVQFDNTLAADELTINGQPQDGPALLRVGQHLDRIRRRSGLRQKALVRSKNSFPMGAGIASSASAFAALTLAATAAAGLDLAEPDLTRLARKASGSAARSIPGGYVQWHKGDTDEESYAQSIASPEHWALIDWVVVLEEGEKEIGSSEGHSLATTSPLQRARVQHTEDRLAECRQALLEKDFERLAHIVELDSDIMHAVMMTSRPPLLYWLPGTIAVMRRVRALRHGGTPVCYTIDAGPNVHCLCPATHAEKVHADLQNIPQVARLLRAVPGGPARLVPAQAAD